MPLSLFLYTAITVTAKFTTILQFILLLRILRPVCVKRHFPKVVVLMSCNPCTSRYHFSSYQLLSKISFMWESQQATLFVPKF